MLPSFDLEAEADGDGEILEKSVLVIVLPCVKDFCEICSVAYRCHDADGWGDVHLYADAWRYEQTETLLFF